MAILIFTLLVIGVGLVAGTASRRRRGLPTPPQNPDAGPTIHHHLGQ
ncbi:hypothetical protein [Paractinoplanes globisporus]|uniref:Uncharacterized protein n=1 Tax=Paractinoplanes globisporus TaxID=113565 RepID=A0ABW6WB41_9ACTN|nr:hypothetical protein [Actinoplanes globisporus]